MGKLQERIIKAGQLWGLPIHSDKKTVFGIKDGLGVQLLVGETAETFVGIIRWDNPDKDSLVQERFNKSTALNSAQVQLGHIKVGGGIAIYTVVRNAFGSMLSTDKMVQRMQTLVDEVKAVVGDIPQVCRLCGAAAPVPVLVDGIVERICDNCLAKTEIQAKELTDAYEALPIHWVRALIVGTILTLIGAIIWIVVIIYTEYMFWLLSIGIGVVIGWATTKAAGKGGIGVQLMCVIFTFISIVGSMIILLALSALDASIENDVLNPALFQESFLKYLIESAGELAFAFGGALIGAVVAAQRAGKPKFDVTVEK